MRSKHTKNIDDYFSGITKEDEQEIKKIDVEIKDIVNDAAEFAKASPEPSVNELFTDIYLEV